MRVAASLSRRTGLAGRVTFCQGSATALPDDAVDRAGMLHVGMSIPDKAALFAEVRRVLVDGGLFGANLVDNFARAVLAPTEMICGEQPGGRQHDLS